MLGSSVNILLIEDNLADARFLHEVLKQPKFKNFSLFHVKRLKEALNLLEKSSQVSVCFDVILLDLTLPDSQGLDSLQPLMECDANLPIVVLTNTNDNELAIEAVRQGAQDYLVKRQVNDDSLLRSLRYAIERKQTLESLNTLNQTLKEEVDKCTLELVKAQELNQFKSEFVSILSHDIRNPLNTILLTAGLLQNSDEQLSKEKKLTHFQMIRSAIKNMALLLDEASFIGKADTGRLRCQISPLDLQDFCSEIIKGIKISAKYRNIHITSILPEIDFEVFSDENLLRHILDNLLTNAVKYSPPGSTVHFELNFTEESIIFLIQDWGIGIPNQEQQQLFQPFYRASNIGMIPGTGLGLSIVAKCVDALQGEIEFNSQVDLGTKFIVKLPLVKV
ncbi:hybrid sensor histidine kinase/response regulator [Mastigocoleus sp. MO_188.B34]|uniref:hybrid sensor histidine kinase/response regulator n=1 Tax=Mastigocoleus sp. MO_188.B34 TaxID=3036635 RepID=UPI00260E9F7E|nr:hybrid sensor histidine kinase/response regulator [Mastigocoleus sp. MO_188.B34]MDJ0695438.1 hybrid sensor histidine kinase/response regulator [Mastigocoleus sp. MO_188.B34]